MTDKLVLKTIDKIDIEDLFNDFEGNYLSREDRRKVYKQYLDEQKEGKRYSLFGYINEKCIGFGTLAYESGHPLFRKNRIPEIKDLNIMPSFRGKGTASFIISELENKAKEEGYETIGIGVGMYPDYGKAQRLYVKFGYIPTGEGLFCDDKQLQYGDNIKMNDGVCLYFTKDLSNQV